MAGGSSSFGGRKSSDCCSKVNVVTSLGISLVGIWMLMSLFSIPLVNSEISSTLKVTEKLSEQYTGISGDFTVNAKREEDATFQGEKGFRRGRSMEEFSDEKGLDSYQNEEREGENSNLSNGEENQEDSGSTDESQSSGESSNLESEEVDSREKGSTSTSGESDNGGEDSNPDGAETTAEDENIVLKSKKGEEENEIFPAGDQSEILKETTTQNGPWSTQAAESEKENESQDSLKWKACKTDAGPDYIPCLDNVQAIRKLPSTSHYEHRERHCPIEASTCLVPLPSGYKQPIGWPRSREQVYLVSAYISICC